MHETGSPCVWVGRSVAATTQAKELGYVPPDISAPAVAATPKVHAHDSSSPPLHSNTHVRPPCGGRERAMTNHTSRLGGWESRGAIWEGHRRVIGGP